MRGVWRRPLFVALVMGCAISLLTVGVLSARLVASSIVSWAFVPLAQVVSLSAIRWMLRRPADLEIVIDRFFAGYTPWLLWLIGFAAFWSSVDLAGAFRFAFWIWAGAAGVVLVWGCYRDLQLFRQLSGKPMQSLLLQRAISWGVFAAVWAGGWLPSQLAGMVGL